MNEIQLLENVLKEIKGLLPASPRIKQDSISFIAVEKIILDNIKYLKLIDSNDGEPDESLN